jgi:hypothetical protein
MREAKITITPKIKWQRALTAIFQVGARGQQFGMVGHSVASKIASAVRKRSAASASLPCFFQQQAQIVQRDGYIRMIRAEQLFFQRQRPAEMRFGFVQTVCRLANLQPDCSA